LPRRDERSTVPPSSRNNLIEGSSRCGRTVVNWYLPDRNVGGSATDVDAIARLAIEASAPVNPVKTIRRRDGILTPASGATKFVGVVVITRFKCPFCPRRRSPRFVAPAKIANRPLLFASASQQYDLGWVMRSLRGPFYALDNGTVTINFVFLKDLPGMFETNLC
jgi:hypothetical protein